MTLNQDETPSVLKIIEQFIYFVKSCLWDKNVKSNPLDIDFPLDINCGLPKKSCRNLY